MPKRGWTTVTIPDPLYDVLERFYAKHVEELRIKRRIKTISTLIQLMIVEHIKREDPQLAAELGDKLKPTFKRERLKRSLQQG